MVLSLPNCTLTFAYHSIDFQLLLSAWLNMNVWINSINIMIDSIITICLSVILHLFRGNFVLYAWHIDVL